MRHLLRFALLAFALSNTARAMTDAPGLPDGAHAAVAGDVIAALSEGDGAAFAALLRSHGTEAFLSGRDEGEDRAYARRFGRRTQGVEVWGHRTFPTPPDGAPTPAELNVLVEETLSERWRQVSFVFEGTRIADFGSSFAMPPEHDPTTPLTVEAALNEIAVYALEAADAELLSGVLLIAQGPDILLHHAYGLASRRYGVPNETSTRFDLASLGKVLTSALVLKVLEQGRFGLDEPIGNLVDDTWINPALGRTITVEHLLTHTSGLDTYFTEAFLDASRLAFDDFHAFAPIVRAQTPAFPPGTSWRYSNVGFLLLGVALESLSDTSYYAILDTQLFQPLGMRDCGCFARDDPVPDVATNVALDLTGDTPVWMEETLLRPARGGPAGGCYATAADLFRFVRALADHSFLSAETLHHAWSDHTPDGTARPYGLGFRLGGGLLGEWVGHSGGFIGPNTELRYYPASDWTVILLSNYSEGVREVLDNVEWLLSRIAPD